MEEKDFPYLNIIREIFNDSSSNIPPLIKLTDHQRTLLWRHCLAELDSDLEDFAKIRQNALEEFQKRSQHKITNPLLDDSVEDPIVQISRQIKIDLKRLHFNREFLQNKLRSMEIVLLCLFSSGTLKEYEQGIVNRHD